MTQRLHDACISVAHRRQVAAGTNIGHRKLRLRHLLQNRSEHDQRPRDVQLVVRGIGDDPNHFDVTTLGPGEPNVLADGAAREKRASQGRRDQRNGGLPRAVIPREVTALQPRQTEQIQ